MIDFKNSFTRTVSAKFAIKLLLKIPPHRKRVATLPCRILMSENYSVTYIGALFLHFPETVRPDVTITDFIDFDSDIK